MRLPGRFIASSPVRGGLLPTVQALAFAGLSPLRESVMGFIGLLFWMILFVLCWPLALLALVLWPLAWLITLPFRLIGLSVEAVFALLKAILFLPARVLGWRESR